METPIDSSPAPYEGRFGKYARKLGEGAAKVVYEAVDLNHGKLVAWNEVATSHLSAEQRERVEREVDVLRSVQHPNIIDFYASWATKDKVVFITEIVESGDLQRFYKNHRVKLKVIKKWCRQILSALAYLHSHEPPIVHRDVKCENILYNAADGTVKIGDLGLSASADDAHGVGDGSRLLGGGEGVVGTPNYMAPEMYDGCCDEGVDIWAFGMCVLEMASREMPYEECSNCAQIFKRVISGVLPEALSRIRYPSIAAFIHYCLTARPTGKRPSAANVLAHPFLDDSSHTPEDEEDDLCWPDASLGAAEEAGSGRRQRRSSSSNGRGGAGGDGSALSVSSPAVGSSGLSGESSGSGNDVISERSVADEGEEYDERMRLLGAGGTPVALPLPASGGSGGGAGHRIPGASTASEGSGSGGGDTAGWEEAITAAQEGEELPDMAQYSSTPQSYGEHSLLLMHRPSSDSVARGGDAGPGSGGGSGTAPLLSSPPPPGPSSSSASSANGHTGHALDSRRVQVGGRSAHSGGRSATPRLSASAASHSSSSPASSLTDLHNIPIHGLGTSRSSVELYRTQASSPDQGGAGSSWAGSLPSSFVGEQILPETDPDLAGAEDRDRERDGGGSSTGLELVGAGHEPLDDAFSPSSGDPRGPHALHGETDSTFDGRSPTATYLTTGLDSVGSSYFVGVPPTPGSMFSPGPSNLNDRFGSSGRLSSERLSGEGRDGLAGLGRSSAISSAIQSAGSSYGELPWRRDSSATPSDADGEAGRHVVGVGEEEDEEGQEGRQRSGAGSHSHSHGHGPYSGLQPSEHSPNQLGNQSGTSFDAGDALTPQHGAPSHAAVNVSVGSMGPHSPASRGPHGGGGSGSGDGSGADARSPPPFARHEEHRAAGGSLGPFTLSHEAQGEGGGTTGSALPTLHLHGRSEGASTPGSHPHSHSLPPSVAVDGGTADGGLLSPDVAETPMRRTSNASSVPLKLVLEQAVDATATAVHMTRVEFEFDKARGDAVATARELVRGPLARALQHVDEAFVPFLASLLDTQRYAYSVAITATGAGFTVRLEPSPSR